MNLADLDTLTGAEVGLSEWIAVEQPLIDGFADLTGDHQFIHVDPVRAAQTPLGGTIAHGFLVLSLVPQMLLSADVPMPADLSVSLNYGMDRLRFISPVRSGTRVRGRFVQSAAEERKPGRWQRTLGVTVEIEGQERPALIAGWLIELS